MPFAWMDLEDGKSPGSRLVDGPEDLAVGEMLFDEEPDPDLVWDAAARTLRAPRRSEDLEELRAARKAEIAEEGRRRAAERLTRGFERDELVMRLCGTVEAMARKLGVTETLHPCIGQVARQGKAVQEALDRLDALDLERDAEAERKIREEGLG